MEGPRGVAHVGCMAVTLTLWVLGWMLAAGPGSALGGQTSSHITGFYADNGLEQTVILDNKLSQRRRREIRQEILALLGLHHRPRPLPHSDKDAAPRFMLELYKSLLEDQEEEERLGVGVMGGGRRNRHHARLQALNLTLPGMESSLQNANLIMSFVNQVKKFGLHPDGGRLFYFESNEVPPTESVSGAELRLYKAQAPWLHGRDPVRIQVFRLTQGRDREDRHKVLETTHYVSAGYEGWLDLNVTGAAQQWTVQPSSNRGLYLEITDAFGRDLEVSDLGVVDSRGPEDRQTFMVAFYKAEQRLHVRKTRSARSTKETQADSGFSEREDSYYTADRPSHRVCQMRTLHVNFKDLGWQEWIIAPESYRAYYCEGECSFPLNAAMNATNHAIVQNLVHLMNPFNVPKPCCAPTKLSAISVLHYDDNSNVILKKFQNMVVRACGCH